MPAYNKRSRYTTDFTGFNTSFLTDGCFYAYDFSIFKKINTKYLFINIFLILRLSCATGTNGLTPLKSLR